MGEENIHLKMERSMMVNINMIRNMDLVFLIGQTVNNFKDIGLMVNKMVKVY